MRLHLKPTDEGEQVDAKYVRLIVPVRYEDEGMPHDFPGRNGDMWLVDIDLETGVLSPSGVALNLFMKVTDSGTYTLLDADKLPLASVEQDYVPHGVVPGEHGDYVQLEIAEDGAIANWSVDLDASEFMALAAA